MIFAERPDDVAALYARAQALLFIDDRHAAERDLLLAVSLSRLPQSSHGAAQSALQTANELRVRGAPAPLIVAAYDKAIEADAACAEAVRLTGF